MPSTPSLADFGLHLGSRKEAILNAWRNSTQNDPLLTTGAALTRDQFRDHIPQVLEGLQRKLSSPPGGVQADQADFKIREEEGKHGLQRWQQGFRQEELMREWGLLHLCLLRELEVFSADNLKWTPAYHWAASRELILLINEGVAESAARYAELERTEAAGRAADLTQAVARLQDLETRRTALIHQVVHDLRGNVQSVSGLAHVLGGDEVPEEQRLEFAGLLHSSVDLLGSMIADLMELARLEAGQERRVIAHFDAAQVVRDLCKVNLPRAKERRLTLRHSGPPQLLVEGDAGKVRRLLQNLLLNALKYTEEGGVTVSWGMETEHWWLIVQDTGPGLLSGPGSPLAKGIQEATVTAREADERAASSQGRVSHVLNQAEAGSSEARPAHQQAGEGIGLSIVKRLCDLLDASIELTSSSESGTTVRVLFPLGYADHGHGG